MLKEFFINPGALNWLWLLVPLIIIYLIRPKPKTMYLPSVHFLQRNQRKTQKASFLRYFVLDPLLLLQMLIIILLALSLAGPFINVSKGSGSGNTVIVIDNSGSSQVSRYGSTRLERAKDLAKDNLGDVNTIIASSSIAELLVENVGRGDAKDAINTLRSKHTTSKLGEAISYAGTFITDQGRLVVISDFANTDTEMDIFALKNAMEAKGAQVEFINVAKEEETNIGIIDLELDEEKASILVKNYETRTRMVDIKAGDLTSQMELEANSIGRFSFTTPKVTTKVSISASDNFDIDNEITINVPADRMVKVLLITNKKDSFIESAFKAIANVQLDVVNPPIVPTVKHDIVIIHDVNLELLIQGVISDIERAVKEGASLIVCAQEGLFGLDLKGMLKLDYTGIGKDASVVNLQEAYGITKDINFGRVKHYLKTTPKEDIEVLAKTADDNSPIITISKYGSGNIMYFGIFEEQNDFKFSPFFPILWNNVVDSFVAEKNINNLNQKTGKVFNFNTPVKIIDPDGNEHEDSMIILDREGTYTIGNLRIAANLLNDIESDIGKGIREAYEAQKRPTRAETVKEKLNIGLYCAIAALLLIFVELFIIKHRGDI